jgi:cephalosporin hydroxylase
MGNIIQKCPLDLWLYQEIIYATKPDLIIETGSGFGGSTLYLANLLDIIYKDNLDKGKVISIDCEGKKRPIHNRITYINDISITENVISQLTKVIEKTSSLSIMAILDSDHSKDYVLSELEIYSKFVTKDNYLIVEDTNINPLTPDGIMLEGPYMAVRNFIKKHSEFIIDNSMHKHLLTFNPYGYLKRISL